jgi:hypothetical protein
VGQLKDLVRVLALLGFAVGNFCRRNRDFRENRGGEHQRHRRAILALTKQYQPLASISTRTYAFLALSGIRSAGPPASRRSTSFRLYSLLASAPHFWASGSRRRISPPSPGRVRRAAC